MSFYPRAVDERRLALHAGRVDDANAEETSASFVCGSFVTMSLRIDAAGAIEEARFRTNGCGFMTASADVVCEWLSGKPVTELHGLHDSELFDVVFDSLGEFAPDRSQCSEIVFDALRKAMASYRKRLVEEFRGETALICTCFGISEDTITEVIATNDVSDVDQVSEICRAGSGCGSCRMLVREMIDSRE